MDTLSLAQNLSFAAALAAFALSLSRRTAAWWRPAAWTSLAALTALMIMLWRETGRPPMSNLHESLLVTAWFTAAAALCARGRAAAVRPAALFLLCVLLAGASLARRDLSPLMPALRSNWLVFHVLTAMASYAALGVAGIYGAWAFLTKKEEQAAPAVRSLVKGGFLLLAAGIITGSIWAEAAWGSYWSWDPKEIWSLITWLFYAGLLHMSKTGRTGAVALCRLAVLGLFLVIFTYLGVNFLLGGLHSYA
ncbi:MAG: cytochrome c-type bioproteinis protein CcsB [Elusimicrobia bacterium]|nr:MAG: cytochrome c-type bioproteinis protein CcsB [Elusimicrobiota bacterium]KAF0158165.1 MAG: cytochrome c-type bioproteinis protein CcsB [Elusimicrobiota bacterium]